MALIPTDIARRLRWPLTLTTAGMVAERAVRRFWPLWTILATALGLLMLGVEARVPPHLFRWGVIGFAAAALVALIWGLWGFRWPSREAALARLDARLPGRPLAALRDAQAVGTGDAASEAVWQVHQSRMATAALGAKAEAPDLRVSRQDPFGLRYLALLLLAMAGLFGSVLRVGSVADVAVLPGGALPMGPTWEIWAEPPRYTGRPSLYLNDIDAGPVKLPEGSAITVRIYGEQGTLALRQDVAGQGDVTLAATGPSRFDLRQSGTLAIDGPGGREWQIVMLPDATPEIALTGKAEREKGGEFSLPFEARDDNRVATARAEFALAADEADRRYGLAVDPAPRAALVLDLPVPFAGTRDEFTERLVDDVSTHPFANLPVTVTLFASDDLGQEGASEPQVMILPGKRFFQPIARALAEQRRDLLWSPENGPRVARVLRAIAWQGDDQFPAPDQPVRLRGIVGDVDALIEAKFSEEAELDAVAEALWELALSLEEETLENARERLRRAQERLEEAMRNGASAAEIAELMDELRAAKNDYMEMLAEQMEAEEGDIDQPDDEERDGEGQSVTQDQIDQMMDEIQRLMEEGKMAEAQVLMDQLAALLENLQMRQSQEGGGSGAGERSMQGLSDTLRDQQELSDESFEELQRRFGSENSGGGNQPDTGGDAESGQPGASPGELAERQRALREQLEEQQQGLGGRGEEADPDLEGAADAMERAEEALRDGDMAGALEEQAEALRSLRDGMRALREALNGEATEEQRTPGEAGGLADGAATGETGTEQQDPLGRSQSGNGNRNDGGPLAAEDERNRARGLQNELNRRQSETARPQEERDYFGRLLNRF